MKTIIKASWKFAQRCATQIFKAFVPPPEKPRTVYPDWNKRYRPNIPAAQNLTPEQLHALIRKPLVMVKENRVIVPVDGEGLTPADYEVRIPTVAGVIIERTIFIGMDDLGEISDEKMRVQCSACGKYAYRSRTCSVCAHSFCEGHAKPGEKYGLQAVCVRCLPKVEWSHCDWTESIQRTESGDAII